MPTVNDNNYDSFVEPNHDLHQLVSAELFSPHSRRDTVVLQGTSRNDRSSS